jgi:virulence factor Mce-like protein
MALFTFSCFGLLLFLWLSFGGSVPLKANKYQLRVSFPEAVSLAEQADVRIAGVKVGKMRRKDLDRIGNRTRAVLDIDSDYAPLPKNTRAVLRQKTLLGETFVELSPGDPDADGYLKDHAVLDPGQVESTVELDEILRTFDPTTVEAFRNWVQSSGLQIRGSAPVDLNNALGNLADFASDGGSVLQVLDQQREAVRLLVRNTGVVFAALNERKGQLRGLIVNSQRTFSALASQDDALAETFAIFPTFLDESRETADRLERFAIDTRPLVNDLKPVADNLGPTVRDLSALSPDLTRLFIRLKPVIRSAPRTLPHAARFLRGAKPVLAALHPFLQELNPILSYLNFDQQVVAHFITNGGGALNYRINNEPNTHLLTQLGIINGRSLSLQANKVPDWARGNAYVAPNTYDRALALGVAGEAFSCENAGGTQRNPFDDGTNPKPPCFEAPPLEYSGTKFPFLKKGEIHRRPPPNFSRRGATPAHPFNHP